MPPSAANRRRRAFTLIEMMISIVIVSTILTAAFEILVNVGTLSTRISNSVDLNKDVYYAIEKLVATIKDGGKLDYEEYWARSALTTTDYAQNGHFALTTGFGNYGSGTSETFGAGKYLCRSTPLNADSGAVLMGSGGCLGSTDSGAVLSTQGSTVGQKQRFGQYRQQYVDYNSDAGSESATSPTPAFEPAWGDEDGNLSIVGDDDDADLGQGPDAVTVTATGAHELYLIKVFPQHQRTLLRYTVRQDPFLPAATWPCDLTTGSGSGCLGNIQVLKLVGKDRGDSHDGVGTGANDGRVDTWTCARDFNCQTSWSGQLLPSGADQEWVDLFPDYVNVKSLAFTVWPLKDVRYAWKENGDQIAVNPYARIQMVIGASGKMRIFAKKSTFEDTAFDTTVNLSDY